MTAPDYPSFLEAKAPRSTPTGIELAPDLGGHLFDYQRDVVAWALRRGRAALFLGTGLGKTACQLEWGKHVAAATGGRVLILAPLAVAPQTVAEGERFGTPVVYAKRQDEAGPGLTITNYERLEAFDPAAFSGVVLDESSILKAYDGKTRTLILESFARTPFRLACTATPAPNDHTELANHAEFLGIMRRHEMLSQFFVHDGGDTQSWRLKGHAEDSFWRWVCEWGVVIRRPSDLGRDDARHVLPPLTMREHLVVGGAEEARQAGLLFAVEVRGLAERRSARKGSIDARVARTVELIGAEPNESWVVWCHTNAEQDALEAPLPGCASIRGNTPADERLNLHGAWLRGDRKVLVTKPSIFGWGLNWQHCARMAFCGLSDSFEELFQSVRRCWRFGQTREVVCHVVLSEAEGSVLANVKRKEAEFERMVDGMLRHMGATQRANVRATTRQTDGYDPRVPMRVAPWLTSEVEE